MRLFDFTDSLDTAEFEMVTELTLADALPCVNFDTLFNIPESQVAQDLRIAGEA